MTLPSGLYDFDQAQIGDRVETSAATITATQISAFADLTGDHFAIHLSDAGAARHGFATQVAHGLLVQSLVEGLKSQCPAQFHALAALGQDSHYRKPVFANDTIHARITVTGKRGINAQRGILTLAVKVFNQHGDLVQTGTTRLMTYRGPPTPR